MVSSLLMKILTGDKLKRWLSVNGPIFNQRSWGKSTWEGIKILKYPTDLFVYQEIIFEIKPDLIVEFGSFSGGSALFLARMSQLQCCGKFAPVRQGARILTVI